MQIQIISTETIYATLVFLAVILALYMFIFRLEKAHNKADEIVIKERQQVTHAMIAKERRDCRSLYLLKIFFWLSVMIAVICVSLIENVSFVPFIVAIMIALVILVILLCRSIDEYKKCLSSYKKYKISSDKFERVE